MIADETMASFRLDGIDDEEIDDKMMIIVDIF